VNVMNTKTVIAGAVMLAVGLGGGYALSQWRGGAAHGVPQAQSAASAPATERKVLYWYDPMVPTQKFDKPGKSPFMDMQLVPKYADEAADANAAPGVSVSPTAQQSLGLRVATADKRALASSIDAVGTVMLNERDIGILQARANGYVERVYARAPGDVVAAGAPIVDVLLPEWLAAQNEFLAVQATGDATLTAASRQRLLLLGMPPAQVEQVATSRQPLPVQTLRAPIGGLIVELMVRQGMTVGMGMNLARINGLNTVWVEAAVPEALAGSVTQGQAAEVRLPATPGQVIKGRISAVLAEANRDTRTLRVRVELPNPGQRLRAGMYAQVSLQGAPQAEAVTVPAEAVVRTGKRAIVYLLDAPGRYRPVEVELGPEVGDRIVVRKGVESGQQVVASGQFLIDSEATLQGVIARAASAPAAAAAPAVPPAAEHHVNGVVAAAPEGGLITIEHDPVPALKWPGMTMPFPLTQPDLGKGLKPGDKVHFSFRQQDGKSVITAIQKVSP
jgi:Cu(I)/Ag(I) efflux system membrane fusion protein